jgi:hypothetical protein
LAKAKAKAAVTKAAVKRKPAKAPARAAVARVAKAPKKAAAAKAVKPAKPTIAAKVAVAKPAKTASVAAAPRKTEPLTLPVAKPVEAPVAKPVPVVRKVVAGATTRADLPPADGFTLLVDGHFKSQFDDLKGAKAAASELKGRFPMLRLEIYDAAKKKRLPAS